MAEKLLAGTPRWAPPIFTEESALKAVDEMFAAANSVPEGAPVGTIARRPDGAWKAERKAGEAGPYWQYSTSAFWQADSPDWNSEDDADSWPVIYDPTKPDAMTRLAKYEIALEEAVRSDPTAQQEPCCGASEVYDCDCPPAIRITPKPRTPRVLPSLDCEEARDGTEWETVEELPSGGRCSYQYRPWAREWWGRSPNERRDGHPGYPFVDEVKVVGPFREVLGDPS